MSFNKGDGVIFRNKPMSKYVPGSFKLDLSGFEGSVYGKASIGARTSVSIWGLCGLGVSTDFSMKCGFFSGDGGKKFALQPEIEFTPSLSTFFWSHKFEDLTAKIELDPIWERYIIPSAKASVSPRLNWTEKRYDIDLSDGTAVQTPASTGIKGIEYKIQIDGEPYDDLKVVLLVYRGSGIKYVPQDPSDPDGAKLSAYRSAGIEHLYSYICDKKLEGIAAEPDQVLEVGTYSKDTASQTYEGLNTSGLYSQGQAYGVVPAIRIGDYYYIVSTGTSGNYYNPFIYWWPNRSNGAPYE